MKKLLALLLAVCSALTCFSACDSNEESSNLPCTHENIGGDGICVNCQKYIPTDKVIYRVSEDGTYAEVCGYDGDESAWREGKFTWLVIAKEYNGVPVTKIADCAFQKIGEEYNGFFNGVYFPDTITHIGDCAFDQCLNLETIYLPSNLAYIGAYAFKQTDLTSVKIPNSVTHICDGAFRECDELTTVEMGDSVGYLGDFVFGGCRSLTKITLPNAITAIGEQVFENCDKLEEVIIPDNVTSIGAFTFVNCDSLRYVEIGDGVENIHDGAFEGCNNLTTVLLGEKVETIENDAFDACDKLETIYYKGIQEEWEKESFNILDDPSYNEQFTKATVYFYREELPYKTGNYWHYDKDGKPAKWTTVELSVTTKMVTYEQLEYVIDKYNLVDNKDYYVIENDEAYFAFQKDLNAVMLLKEEMTGEPSFENYVILCFVRWVSGSVEFIPIEYCYCEETNEIIRRTTYQAAENVEFPDVVVANCIDFVEVPRDIFEKLNKN